MGTSPASVALRNVLDHPPLVKKSWISKEMQLWALPLECQLGQGHKRGADNQPLNVKVMKCLGQALWRVSLAWRDWEQGPTVPFGERVALPV